MTHSTKTEAQLLGLVWIDCPYPLAAIGLECVLERETRVHVGREAPKEESPSFIIICTNGSEDLAQTVKRVRQANLDAPILVFGLHLDLPLAHAALRTGTRGFIHAEMQPDQIIRALKVAAEGEIAAPRELLAYLIANEDPMDLSILSSRQREILALVGEGLTNAQIAKRLYLTESTIKQHLRTTYKILGVSNRIEAAKLARNDR